MDASETTYLDEQGRYRAGLGRPDPPIDGDETVMLLGYLERQRATFAWKTGGLGEAGLRKTLGGSTMTLGGMVKHLTRFEDDMSTEWLRGMEQLPPWNTVNWDAEHDWDWRTGPDDPAEELYANWVEAVKRSRALFREALASEGLGGKGGAQPALPSIRYVLLNMIEEYARHNGHADLIRESVDGLVGHDPPE